MRSSSGWSSRIPLTPGTARARAHFRLLRGNRLLPQKVCARTFSSKTPVVYVVSTPMVGMEGLEAMCKAMKMEFPELAALHSVVVVQDSEEQVWRAWDFLPNDPLSPLTAAALLSGGSVGAQVRERLINYLPSSRRLCLGPTSMDQASPGSPNLIL
eukprot:jgi/Botrbrau1/14428/Bobra.0014s0075.2